MAEVTTTSNRLERRKAHTRAALISAAQSFLAAGTLDVPILEITQAADVGLGSFYNHFESKEELFQAAVEDALELFGSLLDDLTADIDDPAVVFTQSFRLFGRLHRRNPEMSKVLINNGLTTAGSARSLAFRALRDIQAGVRNGRFTVRDPELALGIIVGASLSLGQFLHDHPERDDAQATDEVAEDLLRMLGIPTRQAQRIMALPLPDLDALGGRDGQAGIPDSAAPRSAGLPAEANLPRSAKTE